MILWRVPIAAIAVTALWIRPALARAEGTSTAPASGPALASDGAPATGPAAEAPQVFVTFVRGGARTKVQVAPHWGLDLPPQVVLRAMGRVWSAPATMFRDPPSTYARLDIPAVRVPTVFALTPPESSQAVAEVVAYPQTNAPWDPAVRLMSCQAPAWFDQWAAAVGLPVVTVSSVELLRHEPAWPGWTLLVTASGVRGLGPPGAVSLPRCSILSFSAEWGDVLPSMDAVVTPAQMVQGLESLASQRWPAPLRFSRVRAGLPGVVNRWAWIAGTDGPLVEQIQPAWLAQAAPVVVSYLPWQEQLGRCERADLVLLELLQAAAKARAIPLTGTIAPAYGSVISDADLLPAAARPAPGQAPTLTVLDVRYSRFPTPQEWQSRQNWQDRPLLVLGDDPRLDEWKWLGIDRAKGTVSAPGAIWLGHDGPPNRYKVRVQLMQVLSQMQVPLVPAKGRTDQNGDTFSDCDGEL